MGHPHNRVGHTLFAITLTAAFASSMKAQETTPEAPDRQRRSTTDGFDYAFDRVSFEVTKSLGKRPAFVIWLLDGTASIEARTKQVVARSKQLYAGKRPHRLYSAIGVFGKHARIPMQEPVSDYQSLAIAAEQIKADNSGRENVFAAVELGLHYWKDFIAEHRPLDVSIVIVTDERGDDFGLKGESAIDACVEAGVRVFCLGHAAPFGQQKGRIRFRYPDGFDEWIAVDQGPETPRLESLHLPPWPWPKGKAAPIVSSGFGPWGLSRLCSATDGRFFIAEDAADVMFTRSTMKHYRPDYRSIATIIDTPTSGKIQFALHSAFTHPGFSHNDLPRTSFRADRPFNLRSSITRTLAEATILDDKLSMSETELRKVIDDRQKITNKRLAATFDLALGRILAMRSRIASFNAALRHMRTSTRKFADPGNNTWSIHSTPLDNDKQTGESAIEATRLLNQVISNHRETPFAAVAKAELDLGFEWTWEESRRDYHPLEQIEKPLLLQQRPQAIGGGFGPARVPRGGRKPQL